ncbi:MAG: MFS transporter [Planctomycetota bacterium]
MMLHQAVDAAAQDAPPPPFDLALVETVLLAMGSLLLLVIGHQLRNVPAKLRVLMMTAFVDMAGLFVVIPLVPFYVLRFHESGETLFGLPLEQGLLTGLVVSAYTVAQLVSAPFWGRCSDRFGRRPVLLAALAASTLAYLLLAFSDSLWLLLLSRIVQGMGGGLVGVIQAYVADAVDPAQRARALGWLSASTNLGVALGPWIGSRAVDLGRVDLLPGEAVFALGSTAPGVVAASLCALNALFAWCYLKEATELQPKGRTRPTIRAAARQLLSHPRQATTRIVLIYAIAIGSAHGINPMLAPYLNDRFHVREEHIGYLFMYIGSLSVFVRVLLLGRVVDRFGEVRTSRFGIVSLAIGLGTLPFASSLGGLALAVAFLPLGMALTFPCLTALLSRLVPQEDRGLYMGMQQTFAGLARVAAPLIYGNAYDLVARGAPFWAASSFVAATLLLGIGLQRATAAAEANAGEAAKR